MFIIKFHWERALDIVKDDTGLFAVNSDGIMAMQPLERDSPEPDAFLGGVKLIGLASIKQKNMVYTFEQITPALLESGIYGLSSTTCINPQFTIIVNELGTKTLWSRGIEKIYFVNY